MGRTVKPKCPRPRINDVNSRRYQDWEDCSLNIPVFDNRPMLQMEIIACTKWVCFFSVQQTCSSKAWMIVPPVRNWYAVRLFGTKLCGSVRGTKTWYEVIWFGPRSVIFSNQFGTNYLFGSVRIFFDHRFLT